MWDYLLLLFTLCLRAVPCLMLDHRLSIFPIGFATVRPASLNTLHCGRQIAKQTRIVNGESTYDGEFPWMVSIQHKKGHLCGGSLIAPQWVLSAAHCFNDADRRNEMHLYRVVLGSNRLSGTNTVTRGISKIISHERFVPAQYINDLALVKLTEPVAFDSHKQPICLSQDNNLEDGTEVLTSGWGFNAEPGIGGKMDDILQKVKVKIVSHTDCTNWYRKAGFPYNVGESHLCAGFKEGLKDSCSGDSGGPLMKKENGYFTLIGIVSSGVGCARPLLPGLYTNVAPFHHWIVNHMA